MIDKIVADVATALADVPDGAMVNLGIGLPTLVANHLGENKEVILHSENGVLGMGPAPTAGEEDYDHINVGKQPVTLRHGDLPNWRTGESKLVQCCSYPLTGRGCVRRVLAANIGMV